ncbi:hypothetical protein [Aestuariivirga sp.]|uniref:hypothetical protein n=1 Tax=Aestuariivirga sp. TaxID=2650926 RepID=UPI0025B9F288|nr:hypothetical protein [Aestuariivirga sp.]MCA3554998.1 hypothetical protein [Aestuariivirga sp.]
MDDAGKKQQKQEIRSVRLIALRDVSSTIGKRMFQSGGLTWPEHAPDQKLAHDFIAKAVPLLRIMLRPAARRLNDFVGVGLRKDDTALKDRPNAAITAITAIAKVGKFHDIAKNYPQLAGKMMLTSGG